MKQWANTGYYKKRQPTRNMRPKVYMELVDGEYIKATCRIIVYNAFIIRGVNLVLNRNTNSAAKSRKQRRNSRQSSTGWKGMRMK